MVAFKVRVLLLSSKELSPQRRVSVTCKSFWRRRKAQLFMFKSWYYLFPDKCLSFITEKSYLSLGNSLGFKIKLSDKSFICIKKVVDLELNLEGHLLQHFECSIYKLELHVKLYQKPWICREKLLWRQKIGIFHD